MQCFGQRREVQRSQDINSSHIEVAAEHERRVRIDPKLGHLPKVRPSVGYEMVREVFEESARTQVKDSALFCDPTLINLRRTWVNVIVFEPAATEDTVYRRLPLNTPPEGFS